MTQYIIRRLLQAIPLLIIISVILFVMMDKMGDPLATMGGRSIARSEDRARLSRQLGLDKPLYMQYLFWLAGNDWTKFDKDGDGVAETPGTRKGILRGDFGTSLVNRGVPVTKVIMDRVPNTLLLMIAAEFVIVFFAILVGVYSSLHQYSLMDNIISAVSFIGYSFPIFFIALISIYVFSVNFKRMGLPYLPAVGMFDPNVGQTPGEVLRHMILPVLKPGVYQHRRLQPLRTRCHAGGHEPGLHPHRPLERITQPLCSFRSCSEKCLSTDRHHRRARFTISSGRRLGDRAHLRLARDGSLVHRSFGKIGYCCGNGHIGYAHHSRCCISTHYGYRLRLARPAYFLPLRAGAMTTTTAPSPTSLSADLLEAPPLSIGQLTWRRFKRHKMAMFGAVMLMVIIIYSFGGALLYSEAFANRNDTSIRLQAPSQEHPFGTDSIGRDILARTMYGGQISIIIAIIAVFIETIVGILIGGISGYKGGTIDSVLMRFTEAVLIIPQIFLLLVMAKYFAGRIPNINFLGRTFSGSVVVIVLIIGLTSWPYLARIVRAQFLSLKENDFVLAARATGTGSREIIFRHILPNSMAPIIVSATLGVANAILTEAYISFLGLGVQPPTATWGNMLDGAYRYIEGAPWLWIFPGLLILLTVMSINFLGDGLRDALDPRSRTI